MSVYINPSSDIFVKYLLGSESNEDLLLSFVNAVLNDSGFDKIISVELKNPFNLKDYPIDKESILDIKATDERGRQFDIEVQSTGDKYFRNRSLYYWAKLYSSQLIESDLYTKLKPTICINVLDFELFPDIDNFHTCFLIREKNNPEYVLIDHLIMHFLELPKLKDRDITKKIQRWLLYFKYEGKEEELMKILIQEDKDIYKAHNLYKRFTDDERLRDLYEARVKWKLKYNTDIEVARQKGIEEGREEGIEEGIEEEKIIIAKKMLQNDMDINNISEITGLKIDEISELKK